MGVVIRQHDAAALGWPYEGLYRGVGSPLDQLTADGVMIVLRGIHQRTLTHHRHLEQEVESITVMSHEHHAISDHQPPKCMFNSLCRLTSKKHQRSTLLALCEGNPLATSGFPSQCMSNPESVSILWRHYLKIQWVGINRHSFTQQVWWQAVNHSIQG